MEAPERADKYCLLCGMWKQCKSPVMEGDGDSDAIWLFVGEAPGADEDDEDQPFVGRSGALAREEIQRAGIPLDKVRMSNAVRCHPEKNDLKKFPKAIDFCRPHILREIHWVNPKVVILFGNTGIQSVLKKKGISKLHGTVIKAHGRFYIPCIHPAYVLRSPNRIKDFRRALSLAKTLGDPKKKMTGIRAKIKLDYIRDKKMLYEFTDLLLKQPMLATDIEGSTLSAWNPLVKPKVGCIGFSWHEDYSICYPLTARIGVEDKIKVSFGDMLEAVKEIWGSPNIDHSLHFGKYDRVFSFAAHGIFLRRYWFDSGLASYAINEERGGHGLKEWAWRLDLGGYGDELRAYQKANPESNPKNKRGDMTLVPGPILYPYNGWDCVVSYRLTWHLLEWLKKEGLYEKPFKFPIMYHNWTSGELELAGLNISKERNEELLDEFPNMIKGFDKKIQNTPEAVQLKHLLDKRSMQKIYDQVMKRKRRPDNVGKAVLEKFRKKEKKELDFGTPANKRVLLFDILKLPSDIKTKTGQLTVKKWVLEDLVRKARGTGRTIVKLLIKRGEYSSSFTKYVKPIVGWIGTDGRTHTTYLAHGTTTGRVSSEKPNHENLPKRYELAKILREQFVPTNDDYMLMEADEKQMELRLICDRAQDDMMMAEFNAGKDPHRMGAAAGFEITEEEVTKELRDFAKNAISFGLQYGRQAPALAADMGWSIRKAEKFISRYFGKYDDCRTHIETVRCLVMQDKQVMSYFGRIRRLPGVTSPERGIVNEAVRQAVNSPIQGDASDITWCAGYRLTKWLQKYKLKSRLVVIVHDALYVDLFIKELEDVVAHVHKFMTDREWIHKRTGWMCSVPWDIDVSLGPNLGTMKELDRTKSGFVIPF